MKLTNLEPASDYKVQEWLEKLELKLTPYQKECLRNSEMIRFAPFEFYKRRKNKKVNIFWRLSIIAIPIYWLIIIVLLPFTFLVRGKWGYSQKFFDNFHAVWMHKLNL